MSDYYDIILTKNSQNREDTLQLISEITNEPLDKIKTKTEKLPAVIHTEFSAKDAYQTRSRFEAINAEVKIRGMSFDEPNTSSDTNNTDFESTTSKIKKTIKIAFNVVEIIALIFVVYLFVAGKFSLFMTDFLAEINKTDNNPYIEMVQSSKPYDNTSYGSAFDSEFDLNKWSYFKSDGKRIVQVVSTYKDINDKMITQFLLTPQEDDKFYIEPYAINVSDTNLSQFERNLVIAALFEGDLSQVLFESLLYGNDKLSNNELIEPDEKETHYKTKKDTLRIATNAEFSPFEYLEDGEFCGFDIDLMRDLCERIGYEPEFVNISYDAIVNSIYEGEYDCAIAAMCVTEERKYSVDFTDTYISCYIDYKDGEDLYEEAFAIVLPKESPLKEQLNSAISEAKEDGTVYRLADKYNINYTYND